MKIILVYLFLSDFQFFIFLAWLNFGRAAVNPFGVDESDIDIKHLLDTHIEVVHLNYLISII